MGKSSLSLVCFSHYFLKVKNIWEENYRGKYDDNEGFSLEKEKLSYHFIHMSIRLKFSFLKHFLEARTTHKTSGILSTHMRSSYQDCGVGSIPFVIEFHKFHRDS